MKEKTKKINLEKIKSEINDLKKSLLNLKFQKSTGQLEKTSELSKIKKKIARLKTEVSISKGEINA